jgi:hypothetical protein
LVAPGQAQKRHDRDEAGAIAHGSLMAVTRFAAAHLIGGDWERLYLRCV